MFYEGDLQTGIAAAVQQSKAVLCYVYDNSELSEIWEREFFGDEEAAHLIRYNAIALKMQFGSQEANYLKALCPIPSAPMGIIIKDGQIQAVLLTQHSKKEFLDIIRRKLGGNVDGTVAYRQTSAAPGQQTASQSVSDGSQRADTFASVAGGVNNSTAQANSTSVNGAPALAIASLRAGNSADAQAGAGELSAQSRASEVDRQRQEYIAQQRQREAAQKAERRRIKESTEADRQERRKQMDLARQGTNIQNTTGNGSRASRPPPTEVRLAVRLLSGRSIRSTFPRSATLSDTIRPWVTDEMRQIAPSDVNIPYTFKLVLAPHPNRTISISEEEMTLEELLSGEETGRGRTGVNFILVPEKSYTDAYSGATGVMGIPARAANTGYGAISSILGGAYSTMSRFLRGENSSQNQNRASDGPQTPSAGHWEGPDPTSDARNGNAKVRTLGDQRAEDERRRRDEQWYNGNQTNFLPRDTDRRDLPEDRKRRHY